MTNFSYPPSAMHFIENVLYVVSTPIGNLWDMTYRAVQVLHGVDMIFCEDTRTSAKVLGAFDIKTPTMAYHDYNGDIQRPKILSMLDSGASIALISDAGTPLINDPGYKLVQACVGSGYRVVPIPGVNAPITALMGAGLASDRFCFVGFIPNKDTAKRKFLQSLQADFGTIIAFESPHRLHDTLRVVSEVLPHADVVVARELTKKFEHFFRSKAVDITDIMLAHIPPKGECVILLRLPVSDGDTDVDTLLCDCLKTMSLKDAVDYVFSVASVPKKTVYQRALFLKHGDGDAV